MGPVCEENTIITSSYEGDMICEGFGILYVCSRCSVSLTVPAQRPSGYTYDDSSKTCIGQAGPGVCLPGFTPDEADTGGACCALEPGSPALSTTPVAPGGTFDLKSYQINPSAHHCPPGTWVLTDPDGNKSCIPVPVEDPSCKYEWIAYRDCTPGPDFGDNQDPSCQPPPGGCPMSGEQWNQNTCSCYCPGGPGFCG